MAGVSTEESSIGKLDAVYSGQQRCQSTEALAEWRSSEQVENGIPSTSPPYWDTDDDDDCGPKPAELYGKYTWKIDKYSKINKRELRSNAFEVGGYKWYILIYPQGCDVCNHLSLFLCVANHDKLLPGWSHFAQFTIAVVNKDPKKSKYSDTLHRFWKKEHDWGWKKFMEISKVSDGFVDTDTDTLIIKAQVQVIRERADRPFRCLDCQYRRELVRVYLTNVEQICRRFVEERRNKLGKLIEDKARWSSFCAFWLGIDQNARRRMSREKTDAILKVVVKHFFIEKEVTSTLVMDSLYSGLRALEGQIKSKKARAKLLDVEEMPVPIVRVEKDTFVLVDDVLLLLERAALEPLPPKDDKGPQNRTKDGGCGEDFSKETIERDERRLTELGRRTIEIFVLAHIFSSKIEVAYQEAVALKRQEELIREEEAAWLAESVQKAKRGATEKEKKSKKKQSKQKRNNRKGKEKEKGRDEKNSLSVEGRLHEESPVDEGNELFVEPMEPVPEKPDELIDISDMSDSVDCVLDTLQIYSDDRDASPVNWDTDTSEAHPPPETATSGAPGLSTVQNGVGERKNSSFMDDSSSTCSTDSVPSVVTNGPYKGNAVSNQKNQKSSSRGKNQRVKVTRDGASRARETHLQPSDPATGTGHSNDLPGSCKVAESDSEAVVVPSQDRIKLLEPHVVKEEVVYVRKEPSVKDQTDVERSSRKVTTSPDSTPRSTPSAAPLKSEVKTILATDHVWIKKPSSNSSHQQTEKTAPSLAEIRFSSKLDAQKGAAARKPPEKSKPEQQVPVMSRPLSAPLIPGPRPSAPVVSTVPTAPLLARSASAAGRLGPDPSPAAAATTHSYVPQSYRNATVGASSSVGFAKSLSSSASSAINLQPTAPMYLPQSPERVDHTSSRSSFSFGMVKPDVLQNGPQRMECYPSVSSHSSDPCTTLMSGIQNIDLYNKPVPSCSRSQDHFLAEIPPATTTTTSGRQILGVLGDEFPHLDIINDLLDDEHGIGRGADRAIPGFRNYSNGPHHLNRQFTFPGDPGMSDIGLLPNFSPETSSSNSNFERTRMYRDDGFHQRGGYGPFDSLREMMTQTSQRSFVDGQIINPNQWQQQQMASSDVSFLSMRQQSEGGYHYQIPEYSNLQCGINGYPVYRPAN